jgi:hypothetical protein
MSGTSPASRLRPAPFIEKAFICLKISGEHQPRLGEVRPYLSGFSVVGRLREPHTIERALAALAGISLPVRLPKPISLLLARIF